MPPVLTLYRTRLDVDPATRERLGRWLDPSEEARALRFAFEADRFRYQVATGFLRGVLGSATGQDPSRIRFVYGEHGKPALPDGPPFNLSHSRSWALVGVATEGEVGVDVEDVRRIPELERLMRDVLHPRELPGIQDVPRAERERLFFRVWTRKEAILKATGLGLSREPSTILVGIGAGADHAFVWNPEDHAPLQVSSVSWTTDAESAIAWASVDGVVRWHPGETAPLL